MLAPEVKSSSNSFEVFRPGGPSRTARGRVQHEHPTAPRGLSRGRPASLGGRGRGLPVDGCARVCQPLDLTPGRGSFGCTGLVVGYCVSRRRCGCRHFRRCATHKQYKQYGCLQLYKAHEGSTERPHAQSKSARLASIIASRSVNRLTGMLAACNAPHRSVVHAPGVRFPHRVRSHDPRCLASTFWSRAALARHVLHSCWSNGLESPRLDKDIYGRSTLSRPMLTARLLLGVLQNAPRPSGRQPS